MSAPEAQPVKVFISYSWTTPAHQQWVLDLAVRLESHHEFSVTLDKWDLKTGNDVNAFMEQMAQENNLIDKVIVVLDSGYVEKANSRKKGAGIEAQIISAEVYRKTNQDKFLPIIRERDDEGNPYLPVFFKSRKYVDFSDDDTFEDAFDELLRDLADKPKYIRPAKTVRLPAHFDEETAAPTRTGQLLRGIDSVLSTRPQLLPDKIGEFLDAFYQQLGQLGLASFDSGVNQPFAASVLNQITIYKPLRDDFISYFSKVVKAREPFDISLLIRFFGRLYTYTQPHSANGALYSQQFDHYRFIVYELFLSIMGMFLKNEQYTYVAEMIYSGYQEPTRSGRSEPQSYAIFYQPIKTLDGYYQTADGYDGSFEDLLLDRVSELVSKNCLVEADLLCYYMSEINDIYPDELHGGWFPATFFVWRNVPLPVFREIMSLRYFEKVKDIYNVSLPSELANKIEDYKRKMNGRPGESTSRGILPAIYKLVNQTTIGRDR